MNPAEIPLYLQIIFGTMLVGILLGGMVFSRRWVHIAIAVIFVPMVHLQSSAFARA